MRFVRTIRCAALTLFLLTLGTSSTSANEIPSLTWERGKTQSVVLGGYAENLDWQISLEGEQEQLKFSNSTTSSAGFIVYSVSLPRELPIGQYQVVARGSEGAVTKVAAIQIVERFQYNVLEIPRDFLFLLFSLVMFLSMQVLLGTWVRRESDGLFNDEQFVIRESPFSAQNVLVSAFASQKLRLKRNWLGPDFVPSDFRRNEIGLLPLLPLVVLVIGLYCGVTGVLVPFEGVWATALLSLLTFVGVLDRYAAKLASIGFITLFVLFNANLNFPALLGLAASVLMLFLPQYVGDVVREFVNRELKVASRIREIREGLASLAAGTSIFWLYLLGESLSLASGTNASKITPVAIAAALGYFIRSSYSTRKSKFESNGKIEDSRVLPILSLRSLVVVSVFIFSVAAIWTGNLLLSAMTGFLLGGSLLSIHLSLQKTYFVTSLFLARAGFQLVMVALLETVIFAVISRMPEVVIDRTQLMFVLCGAPLAILAIVRLFTQLPSAPSGFDQSGEDSTRTDLGERK